MRTSAVRDFCLSTQGAIYKRLNEFSITQSTFLGRFIAIPTAIVDVAIDTLFFPLNAIECLVVAVFNLIGAIFSRRYSIKDCLSSLQVCLLCGSFTSLAIGIAPIKIIYQVVIGFLHPNRVRTINLLVGERSLS